MAMPGFSNPNVVWEVCGLRAEEWDVIELEISKLGVLRNKLVRA
jgi:hypothetical protein